LTASAAGQTFLVSTKVDSTVLYSSLTAFEGVAFERKKAFVVAVASAAVGLLAYAAVAAAAVAAETAPMKKNL